MWIKFDPGYHMWSPKHHQRTSKNKIQCICISLYGLSYMLWLRTRGRKCNTRKDLHLAVTSATCHSHSLAFVVSAVVSRDRNTHSCLQCSYALLCYALIISVFAMDLTLWLQGLHTLGHGVPEITLPYHARDFIWWDERETQHGMLCWTSNLHSCDCNLLTGALNCVKKMCLQVNFLSFFY